MLVTILSGLFVMPITGLTVVLLLHILHGDHIGDDSRRAQYFLYRIPIVREMTNWFGAIDASKANCELFLK